MLSLFWAWTIHLRDWGLWKSRDGASAPLIPEASNSSARPATLAASMSNIIKRSVHKSSLRTREPVAVSPIPGSTSTANPTPSSEGIESVEMSTSAPMPSDLSDDALMRQLLRPPPIPGVENWGIPSSPATPCDSALEAKIRHFKSLKEQGKHFNDSLMSNKAFRNPHIYAKLVEFVDVNEMGTKFPKATWDPLDLQPEWYSDRIAAKQKERYEQAAAAQAAGKRSHIDFASSSSRLAKDHREKDGRFRPYPTATNAVVGRSNRLDPGRGDERDRRKDGKDKAYGGGRDWRR
ncbi:HCNGP-domain-containing protein [Clavulina sp. PMI_390]|nr:HCNGP-domain-containing protein [Clavulina sp. PMI_390]